MNFPEIRLEKPPGTFAAFQYIEKIIYIGGWETRVKAASRIASKGTDEEAIVQVLNHEFLHALLDSFVDNRTGGALDNLYVTNTEPLDVFSSLMRKVKPHDDFLDFLGLSP